ncbi:hypothetical protein QL285_029314 [Trifolium repens]|nr:hypothetical protein QL285_029314 [Trifolium repens]
MESLRRKVLPPGALKAKLFSSKRKCVKKRKTVSFNVVAKKITKFEEEEEERVNDHKGFPFEQTRNSTFIDDREVKRTLSNRKELKIQRESEEKAAQLKQMKRLCEREAARRKIEQIKNTARLNENMDSMHAIGKFIGYSFNVVAEKITKFEEEEEERVNDHKSIPLEQTRNTTFIDDREVKKTISNWKQLKIQHESEEEAAQLKQMKRLREREAARLKIEQIKNTARLSENMDSMHAIDKFMGYTFSYC